MSEIRVDGLEGDCDCGARLLLLPPDVMAQLREQFPPDAKKVTVRDQTGRLLVEIDTEGKFVCPKCERVSVYRPNPNPDLN